MKEASVLDRRAKLLDEVADYILNNGLADLSLRPLATVIGTSPRMLLYFFGSKERLVAEALAHIRAREQIDFKRAVSKPRPADRVESLLQDWRSSASPRREKYSRLFFEVYGLALQNPEKFPEFLERAVGDWLPMFEQAFAAAGVSPAQAQTLATLAFIWTCSLPANESVPRQLFRKC
jgi:AcrR family transcriptional regulator